MEFTVRITRHYGAVSYGLDLTGSVPSGSKATDLDAAVQRLNALALRELRIWEQEELRKFPAPPTNGRVVGSGIVSDTVALNVKAIVKSVNAGEIRYDVKTHEPQGAKYGIPLYGEVAERYNIPERLQGDVYQWEPEGVRAVCLVVKGKTKKVIRLEGLPDGD